MDVPSAALTLPTTTCGGTLCAGADMGQDVMGCEGKLVVEVVRFISVPPPCSHTMCSFAQTLPILKLIIFPSHEEETGALVGIGVAVGNGRGVAVGTDVGLGTNVGVFVGCGTGVLVGLGG